MKKLKIFTIFLTLLCLTAAMLPAMPARAVEDPTVESSTAVVMDRITGEVFYAKNAEQRVAPASITKIMTVLLAVEAIESGAASLNDPVTASPSMTYDLIAEGSSAGIMAGETMTLENLLYCAMLSSANEACNVIAEHIGGTISDFILRMNQRAEELGCTGTHFANTHGLPNSSHYTTASDFCRISMEAANHSLFMDICNTPSIDIPATNVSAVRNLKNSNALICVDSMYGSSYLYEYAAGIKTGHTNDAGYCLISTAEKDGIKLLAAVFGGITRTADSGRTIYTNFSDSITLYDWVFNNFSYQEVLNPNENVASVDVELGRDSDYVNLRPAGSVTLLLPNDFNPRDFSYAPRVYSLEEGKRVTAPVSAGEVLGEISVMRNGQNLGTVKLVASSSVDLSRGQYVLSHIKETVRTPAFIIIAVVVVLVIAAYVILVVRYRARRKRSAPASAKRRVPEPSAAPTAPTVPSAPAAPQIEFIPNAEGPSGVYYNDPNPAARPVVPAQPQPLPKPEPPAPTQTAAPAPAPTQVAPPAPAPTVPEAHPAEPTRPAPAPVPRKMPYFEQEEPDAPVVPSKPAEPPAAPESEEAEDPLSLFRNKADRDYFEEFFRRK